MKTDQQPLSLASHIVVFGHRGVGKTAFMQRLKLYWQVSNYVFLDLDQEIEKCLGLSVEKLFNTQGEFEFRKHEKEIYLKLLSEHSQLILSVGGGFPVQDITPDVHALWIRRVSDDVGRIFLNRPRLNPNLSDLEEFTLRVKARQPKFEARADEIYLMPEGLKMNNLIEREIFAEKVKFETSGYLTITKSLRGKHRFLKKVSESGFEFRDDFFKFNEFCELLDRVPVSEMILSFRDQTKIKESESDFLEFKNKAKNSNHILVDWALELGSPQQLKQLVPNIYSLHEYLPNEDLKSFLKRFEAFDDGRSLLKASPLVTNFTDLEVLWNWQQEDVAKRSVLPRSDGGLWVWFRQLMKGQQKINFWKSAEGSAQDQPSLYQWLSTPQSSHNFAAILGSPVAMSHTPIEQQDFFHKLCWPVFAIDLQKDEFTTAIPFLQRLGLRAAAVTSPLKKCAFELVHSGQSEELDVMNTLYFVGPKHQDQINGTNTDLFGFRAMVQPLLGRGLSVLVWGGGGTLPVIKNVFPEAVEYAVRTGLPREGQADLIAPDIVIWAAGPTAEPPQLKLNPKYIVDLNYREDSQARAFAKTTQAIYISGEEMFRAQAQEQRVFWKQCLKKTMK